MKKSATEDDRLVLPDVKTARTFGTLNVLAAPILIVVFNLWSGAMYLAAPTANKLATGAQELINKTMAGQTRIQVEALKRQEEAATDPTQKENIQKQIQAVEKNTPPRISTMTAGFTSMSHPVVLAYGAFDILTGITLNILMLFSGIGLLGLRESGRKLAVQVAALKLVRIAILFLIAVFVVVPIQSRQINEQLAPMFAEIKAKAGPQAPAMSLAFSPQFMTVQILAGVVTSLMLASVYPALAFFRLRTLAVKAACNVVTLKPEADPAWETS